MSREAPQPLFRLHQRVRYTERRVLDRQAGVLTRHFHEGTVVRLPTYNIVDEWAKRAYYGVRVDAPDGQVVTIYNAYETELEAL